MPESLAIFLVRSLAGYAGVGLLFAVAFVVAGARRIDPRAAGAGLGFKLLILPGAAAVWPLLLWRWWQRRGAVS